MRRLMFLPAILVLGELSAFAVFGVEGHAQDLDPDAVWQRYVHIVHDASLEWRQTEPFFLKLDYQLYDLDGKPSVQGSADLSWGDGTENAERIHSPSFPGLSLSGELPFSREPFLIDQLLKSLARPFPNVQKKADLAVDKFKRTIGAEDLDCFALNAPGKTTDSSSVYCTDSDSRLVALMGFGGFTLLRKNFRKYRDREVPLDIELSYSGRNVITGHLAELDPLPPGESKKISAPAITTIPGSDIAAAKLKSKDPKYPKQALREHIGGYVVICAVISRQGNIKDLDVVASPDPLLTQSAKDAVSKWTYKPYVLRGEPVDVETTITVRYSLNQNR